MADFGNFFAFNLASFVEAFLLLFSIFNAILAWFIVSRGVAVQRLLGKDGTKIFTRIMGLLTASKGVAIVREGIVAIAKSVSG